MCSVDGLLLPWVDGSTSLTIHTLYTCCMSRVSVKDHSLGASNARGDGVRRGGQCRINHPGSNCCTHQFSGYSCSYTQHDWSGRADSVTVASLDAAFSGRTCPKPKARALTLPTGDTLTWHSGEDKDGKGRMQGTETDWSSWHKCGGTGWTDPAKAGWVGNCASLDFGPCSRMMYTDLTPNVPPAAGSHRS